MKTKGTLWLSLIMILLLGWASYAQDAGTPPEATPTTSTDETPAAATPATATGGALDWQEGVFALLVVAVVMLSLIGVEWIHRRNRSAS